MNTPEESFDYQRIATAIAYIYENFKQQPDLEEVAEAVHISPYHFQRMFSRWAGVSPKKFLQFISVRFAKDLMKGGNFSLSDISFETGLSGTSRLHDLFINIEAMTPGEYNAGGKGLNISYGVYHTFFGKVMLATTAKGICNLNFIEEEEEAASLLQKEWPNAVLHRDDAAHELLVNRIFNPGDKDNDRRLIQLNIKGTPFQLKVWEALLKIPERSVVSYNQVAEMIHQPTASRAVGSAVGKNPVGVLIPCHRVIKKVGGIGEYHWGPQRKLMLLSWEQCQGLKEEIADAKLAAS